MNIINLTEIENLFENVIKAFDKEINIILKNQNKYFNNKKRNFICVSYGNFKKLKRK